MAETCEFRFDRFKSRVYISREYRFPERDNDAGWLAVFDRKTHDLFGSKRDGFVPEERCVVLGSGERRKTWASIEKIERAAVDLGMGRDSVMVAVGGGIVCDLAAFAASIYMRGCRLKLVPTTLLAMVDAAVGGKTGINFLGFKNMLGSFYPAEEIHIFSAALDMLPDREYRSGLAEVIKTALLGDRELYDILVREIDGILKRDPAIMEEVVRRCVALKGRIVEEDLREEGVRAHLNLGHTFAHALEAVKGLKGWIHGEAVAWGIAGAMELGVQEGVTDPVYAGQVRDLLDLYGFRLSAGKLKTEAILHAMRKDKKRIKGSLRVVLQKDLGETIVVEIEEQTVAKILRSML